MEVGLPNRKSDTEVMVAKPEPSECEENQTKKENGADNTIDEKERKKDEIGGMPRETKEGSETSDMAIRSALPPAEMFEIRNSPPLPFAGNKKLKKLIEKNKKYVSNIFSNNQF